MKILREPESTTESGSGGGREVVPEGRSMRVRPDSARTEAKLSAAGSRRPWPYGLQVLLRVQTELSFCFRWSQHRPAPSAPCVWAGTDIGVILVCVVSFRLVSRVAAWGMRWGAIRTGKVCGRGACMSAGTSSADAPDPLKRHPQAFPACRTNLRCVTVAHVAH